MVYITDSDRDKGKGYPGYHMKNQYLANLPKGRDAKPRVFTERYDSRLQ
jgi:hypothetical protein